MEDYRSWTRASGVCRSQGAFTIGCSNLYRTYGSEFATGATTHMQQVVTLYVCSPSTCSLRIAREARA